MSGVLIQSSTLVKVWMALCRSLFKAQPCVFNYLIRYGWAAVPGKLNLVVVGYRRKWSEGCQSEVACPSTPRRSLLILENKWFCGTLIFSSIRVLCIT